MFSPDYVRLVLNDNFEDAKALLLSPLIAVHYAHLAMLVAQQIITREDARALRAALDAIDLDAVRAAKFDGSCEDLFFYVDRLVADRCGPDAAGRLHTARSRNDIDMTMYRMQIRVFVLDLVAAVIALRGSLIELAARHRETVFPAHTHTQPAQPSTVAHYLLAVIEQLERDTGRLFNAYATVNRNPLGACAITGTGFPIDRDRTSQLLGFDGPTGNTYGSIAAVDYLLEAAAAAATTLVGAGRFVQDMLLWCTVEVGYLRLPDGFVQTSSIMPQKRNPVSLEHARSLASKAFAQLAGLATALHNTPFGDIVDSEDDLQPLVASGFRDAARSLELVAAAMAGAEIDVALMRQRATENWVSITELADTLARDRGLSFKTAHTIAASLVRAARARPGEPLSVLLADASRDAGHPLSMRDDELAQVLSPERFVEIRRTHGGPSPEVTARAIEISRGALAEDGTRLAARREALAAAARQLRRAVEDI
ncbi:MAG TPA: argininosuccinate lyase [Vicinamibacterales bacterium]|nr:argininosuccinate lyase [Vicinamibacterales bacterium]